MMDRAKNLIYNASGVNYAAIKMLLEVVVTGKVASKDAPAMPRRGGPSRCSGTGNVIHQEVYDRMPFDTITATGGKVLLELLGEKSLLQVFRSETELFKVYTNPRTGHFEVAVNRGEAAGALPEKDMRTPDGDIPLPDVRFFY